MSSTTWDAPVDFAPGGVDGGYRVVDVNNDGLPAIIASSTAWVDSGSGWVSSSTWKSPVSFSSSSVSTGAIVADVNGDGLPDILYGQSSVKAFQIDTQGTLTANLQSYYKLEDANDFWSTNNLTNNNGVTFDSGIVNNGADFGSTNTNKTLSTTSTLSIDGGAMSMGCWVNITTVPGNYDIAIQGNNSSKVLYYLEYYSAGSETIG